jgi:hypothetical protein
MRRPPTWSMDGLYSQCNRCRYTTRCNFGVLVVFMALFMFFYDCGVGVASYPIATELLSSRFERGPSEAPTALGTFSQGLLPSAHHILSIHRGSIG